MELFEQKKRTYTGPSNHNENPYGYYDRSARKDISVIRETLNEWFRKYPNDEKLELRNSFKKKFDDCFYELFLHQLFTKLGFDIQVHPDLPNTSKKPDFLLKKGDLELYAEAKIVKNKSHQQEAIERKINEFYDNISKLDSKGFLLIIDTLILKSNNQPSTKRLIKRIEEEIEKLDPDLVTEEISTKGFESTPIIEIENEDILLRIKPIPVVKSARDKKKRPIGMYPMESFWGGGEDSLKESISMKAKRYGKLDKPFIVCVNTLDVKTSGTHDIENAIWGSSAISWSTNPDNKDEKWIRKRDGVFLGEKEPKLKSLSGVLVTKVFTHNIPVANYWLYKHPFSENGLEFNSLGLKFNFVENGKIKSELGDDLGNILKIENDWLNK
ncbi:hypothetical protein AWN68_01440 [Roseivirga echinicomitans]|uniref:Restriction endonuclease n=2 Tax=Roseivirga echinicomitans TaxID=296218 RepID=A0A150XYZ1_9BACT|nr:hypothetical protein AWN68_01440 [Roseivirga echinicomitans]